MKNKFIKEKLNNNHMTLTDTLKNTIINDPNYIAFGNIELEYVDNCRKVRRSLPRELLRYSLERYYIKAYIYLKHLDFRGAYMCYSCLFDQAVLYKQIPIKYLIGFSKVLFCLNKFEVCYDFLTFLYSNICKEDKESKKEAQKLLEFIKDIEKLSTVIKDPKDINLLKDYIVDNIVTKENIIDQDDEVIISELNKVSNIVTSTY